MKIVKVFLGHTVQHLDTFQSVERNVRLPAFKISKDRPKTGKLYLRRCLWKVVGGYDQQSTHLVPRDIRPAKRTLDIEHRFRIEPATQYVKHHSTLTN